MDPAFVFNLVAFLVVLILLAIGLRFLVPLVLQHFKGSAGGWNRLSEAYPTTRQRPARVFTRQSLLVGQVLYRNCVIVGFDDAGLYLEMESPVSILGKQPLFIPWTAFKSRREGRLFWRKAAVLSVGEPPLGTITVPMSLFEMMQPAVDNARRTPANAS